jgi:hypothetical protein
MELGRRGDTVRDRVILWRASSGRVAVNFSKCESVSPSWLWLPHAGRARPPRRASRIRPLIGKDYPLSLSISLSGGEETNQDFPSNGERTGKSPA